MSESNGSRAETGFFDPAKWRSPGDNRLDPTAKIAPAAISKIEIRKPPPDHFVRVHGNPEFNEVFDLYSDSEGKRFDPYLISPSLDLPPQVRSNIKRTRLAVAVSDTGKLFLWWIQQSGSEWHESGDAAVMAAMVDWVKIIPDERGYRREYPQVTLPPPAFPDWSFGEYLSRAFRDRTINTLDHEIIRRLAGIR